MKSESLEITAESKNLSKVRQFVEPRVKQMGFTKEEVYHIVLAVDEACSNVIRHAYLPQKTLKECVNENNRIVLKIESYPKKVKIKIRDYGIKCDPKKIRGRELSEVKPGGLGVHLIHGCMDEVRFDTSKKVGTELVLTKQLRG